MTESVWIEPLPEPPPRYQVRLATMAKLGRCERYAYRCLGFVPTKSHGPEAKAAFAAKVDEMRRRRQIGAGKIQKRQSG